jgi:hypothetical protein
MERIRETIGRYLPFAWWVFLALLAVCGCVCCSVQAAAGFGEFWAVCGAIGSGLSIPIYATQAYVEWLDRNNY